MSGKKINMDAKKEEDCFVSFTHDGKNVMVKNHLSAVNMASISSLYLENYFSDSPNRVLEAEVSLMLAVVDLCTNIEVKEDTISLLLSDFLLWDTIRKKISNYGDFRFFLKQTVEEYKEDRRIANSFAEKAGTFFDTLLNSIKELANTDISPERLEQIKSTLGEINSSPILKNLSEKMK